MEQDGGAMAWAEAENGAGIDFTALLSEAIQAKRAREAKAIAEKDERSEQATKEAAERAPRGKALTYAVTPEQITRINAGDRAAVDKFYFDNLQRLTYSAYRFMRNNAYLKTIVSHEDLLQQVYFDLRAGIIRFRPFDTAINGAVFTSFRYAAVGGLDELYIYQTVEERGKCRREAS